MKEVPTEVQINKKYWMEIISRNKGNQATTRITSLHIYMATEIFHPIVATKSDYPFAGSNFFCKLDCRYNIQTS